MIEFYNTVRAKTEEICAPLNPEDYNPQIVLFASPAKWHLGHTTWFFETFILKKYADNYVEFNSEFNFIFNSYYNNIGDRINRANRGNLTRPVIEKVYAYRKYVDEHLNTLLATKNPVIEPLLMLGLNHEQQHQELLITDLKYLFANNPTYPVYKTNFSISGGKNTEEGWLNVDEGVYEIGSNGDGFVYDNELGAHKQYIHKTSISKALVTNGEFIEFIENGGYGNFNLWLDEGWSWINSNGIKHPLYWFKKNNTWYRYTLGGTQKVKENEILCHINYFEANAFANYKGMRLPTEFEWEVAANKLNWGQRWEWTQSAYLPYPGFKTDEGAVGEYNGKFMINQMVLRGASEATAKNHSRITYRNFFHPQYQWQCTGIRLAK